MQWIVNGLAAGLVIGLLALAFMLVYSSTRVFFIALAGVYSVAPFIAEWLTEQGLPVIPACALGAAASGLVAALLEVANHWPLTLRGTAWAGHLVSSLGINMVIVQLMSMVWGNKVQVLSGVGATGGVKIGHVSLSQPQLMDLGVVPVCVVAVFFWSRLSRAGIRLRGLASNPEALALSGVDIRATRLAAFALSGGLAGVASLLRASDIGFDAVSGLGAFMLAFVALVVGGKDTFWGGPLGGVVIGLGRSAVAWYLSARWQEGVTFAVLALFLLVLPSGLLGRKVRLEAQA
jgi:branched-chain amino acid transport system permease protein